VREADIGAPTGAGTFDRAVGPVVMSGWRLSPFGAVESGQMEIVLVSGRCIVVDVSVDSAAFDRVINILDRP
jgi:hypothetical protein